MYRIDSVSLKHSVFSLYEELSNCRTQTPTFAILVELLILDLMTFTTGCDHFRPLKSSILTIRPAKVCKVSAPTAMSDGSHSCAKPMDGPRTYPSDMAPNPTQDCWCSSTNDNSPLAKDHATTQMARTDHRRNLPAQMCASEAPVAKIQRFLPLPKGREPPSRWLEGRQNPRSASWQPPPA
jgi:hypothetical protein